jgi:signal transduction histidine kinase
MLVPLLLDVVASAPAGGRAPTRLRWTAIGAYVISASLAGLLVLSRDSMSDTACWDFCGPNPFLLTSLTGLEPSLGAMVTVLSALGGTAIAVTAAARLVGATAPARRDLAPVLLPALLAGALVAGRAMLYAGRHAPGPSDPASLALHQALAWVLVMLAAGVILVARRHHRVRVALAELAFTASDGSSRRSAAAALTAATGDTSLRVAYPLAHGRGLVDADGIHVEATPQNGRARATVARAGATIAVIEHDPDVIDPADLIEQIGPALRLSLENDRLDAELWARLRELRVSRARIVAAGDAERVRRERALHDGAQQRLLALTYDLRAARDAAAAEANGLVMDHLDAAVAAVHSAHDELRELAHGIYPAVLGEAGLQPALEGLAERARIPVRLETDGAARCDQAAEMTAYVVAEALVHDARAREATRVSLRLVHEDESLVLVVEDDGRPLEAPITHGVDRAGAAGGRLMLTSRDRLVSHRLEVPCASS